MYIYVCIYMYLFIYLYTYTYTNFIINFRKLNLTVTAAWQESSNVNQLTMNILYIFYVTMHKSLFTIFQIRISLFFH